MRKGLRKKYQKQLTRTLRKTNKTIRNDDLWRGRFYLMQRSSDWHEFEDGSGGYIMATIRAYDHKTGKYLDHFMNYAPYLTIERLDLLVFLNRFIIDHVDAWHKDDPRSDTTDYRQLEYMQNDRRPVDYFGIKDTEVS